MTIEAATTKPTKECWETALDNLSDELEACCFSNGIPHLSADELIAECHGGTLDHLRQDQPELVSWLEDFAARYEFVMNWGKP
jgi:DNA-binding helix-hairpin-helix protein with protein kinase domain